jgi:hypothetical protein
MVELGAYLARRGFKLPEGKSLTDFCRKRTRDKIYNHVARIIDYEDGEIVHLFDSPTEGYTQETLDCLFGKSPDGRWIGGPLCSRKIVNKWSPSSLRVGPLVENPLFLQPPATAQHMERKFPPSLSNPPVVAGRYYNPTGTDANPAMLSAARLRANGRLQWARNSVASDSQYADFGQTIAELRDVSRLLAVKIQNLLNVIGSTYLAVAFGWKPLISDVQKLAQMAKVIDKKIAFLRKNAGKSLKRKRTLYNYTDDLGVVGYYPVGYTVPFNTIEFGRNTNNKIYGTGSYKATYHSVTRYELPETADLPGWDEEAYKYLIGLKPDATLIWELAPFSWLVDWFVNIGDFVEARFGSHIVETTILEEWITITCNITTKLTVPTIAGGYASFIPWTPVHVERSDTFKHRYIPPEVAPLAVHPLNRWTTNQQAIIAALIASRLRY